MTECSTIPSTRMPSASVRSVSSRRAASAASSLFASFQGARSSTKRLSARTSSQACVERAGEVEDVEARVAKPAETRSQVAAMLASTGASGTDAAAIALDHGGRTVDEVAELVGELGVVAVVQRPVADRRHPDRSRPRAAGRSAARRRRRSRSRGRDPCRCRASSTCGGRRARSGSRGCTAAAAARSRPPSASRAR